MVPIRFMSNKRRTRKKILSRIKNEENISNDAIFKNIAFGISKGRTLYKELVIKVHPDTYSDELKDEATRLSQEVSKNKRNYSELLNLKEHVENLKSKNEIINGKTRR